MGKFEELYALNVNDKTEDRDGLTYLAWAWAWAEFKKAYPDGTYRIKKDESGRCYFGDEDVGYMVYTDVTADGITHEMWLAVLDGANKAMKRAPYTYEVKNKNFKYATLNKTDGKYYDNYGNEQTKFVTKTVDAMTMFDVNKALMRCLVKNIAMFGIGLYIYAGEDIPENEAEEQPKQKQKTVVKQESLPTAQPKRETTKTAPKTNDKKQSDGELTMTELVSVWGVKNPEETMLWLEKRIGVYRDEWTIEEHKLARDFVKIGYEKRKAEAAKMRQALQKAGGEVPFDDVE